MITIPLPLLDRRVAAAVRLVRAGYRGLLAETDGNAPNPLARERPVSSRATYQELAEHPDTPLVAPLRDWVAALTLERVLWPDVVRVEVARAAETVELDDVLERTRTSPRALVRRLVAETAPGQRDRLASALLRGASGAASAAFLLAERRAEAASLLGVELDRLELPFEPASALASVAARFLASTRGWVRSFGQPWQELVAAAVGRDLGAGWPAKLSPRWIEDVFRGTGLLEGPRLGLVSSALARRPIGASSFARALASFGATLADAGAASPASFVLARRPFDLIRERRAMLFGSLTADAEFGVRALGLGRDRARDQTRGVAQILLFATRLDAVKALLSCARLLPADAFRDRFAEITDGAFGRPFPPEVARVFPVLSPGDPVRFAGALLAGLDRDRLVEAFDVDWFRNPRASFVVRAEDAEPVARRGTASAEELESALAATLAAFEAALS